MNEHEEPREGSGGQPADGDDDAAPDVDATVAEGVEHLQSAAREMIAAARTFLDVVEEAVGDNAAVASVAEALGSFGQAVSRAASGSGPDRGDRPGTTDREDDGGNPSRVQHIDLS